MLLCVNVGNTNTQFGLFDGTELQARAQALTAARGPLPSLATREPLDRVVLASVVPSRTETLLQALTEAAGVRPQVVGRDLAVPMEVRLAETSKVGVDRLLCALAAYRRTGAQTIVVDAGTAVTVDLVSASGVFCGGSISPGPALLLRAMHQGTEKLPEIEFERPHFVVGRNTEEAMRSGAFWGTVGAVERLIQQIRGDLIGETHVVGTGGWVRQLAPYIPTIDLVAPDLALEGLALVAAAG